MMVSQKISFAVYVVFHESNKKNCMTQSQYWGQVVPDWSQLSLQLSHGDGQSCPVTFY